MPTILRPTLLVLFLPYIVSPAAAADFSAELARGEDLIAEIAKSPPKATKMYSEARIQDQVVGYSLLSIEPAGQGQCNCVLEAVATMPNMRMAALLTAVVDTKLRPKRIELWRVVSLPDGRSMTHHETCTVEADKIVLTREGGPGKPTETKALPRESFFFLADLLLARADLSRVKEPFALREINPQKGETRVLVFRPSVREDGTSEIRSFVDGQKPEGTYRFDKSGRLVAYNEAGAPMVMTPVDEQQGQALRKRFGPPTTQPTSRAK